MTSFQIEILIIASLAAIATALPGVFLVLRGMALMSDAISHAILLGIAVMFLLVHRLDSAWLFIGATLAGLLTTIFTEKLVNTQRIKKDAAIGLVFPLFFSLGVILINQYAHNVHLDTDMVLLGELTFAPLNRWLWGAYDMGPIALWTIAIITLVNIIFITIFYKEFMLATFDKDFASVTGFNPTCMHYMLMCITSITSVGSFNIVGSIVVVALMITPPATAYLLTQRLSSMIFLSTAIGVNASVWGYFVAHMLDVSIAGCIASMCGVQFLIALCISPHKGLYAQALKKQRFKQKVLLDALYAYLCEQPHKAALIQQMSQDLNISSSQIRSLIVKEITGTIKLDNNNNIVSISN